MSVRAGSVPWARMTTTRGDTTEPVSCLKKNKTSPLWARCATLWPFSETERQCSCEFWNKTWGNVFLVLGFICSRSSRCYAGWGDKNVHGEAARRAVSAGGRRGAGLPACGRYVASRFLHSSDTFLSASTDCNSVEKSLFQSIKWGRNSFIRKITRRFKYFRVFFWLVLIIIVYGWATLRKSEYYIGLITEDIMTEMCYGPHSHRKKLLTNHKRSLLTKQ